MTSCNNKPDVMAAYVVGLHNAAKRSRHHWSII